jgi:hypothetical protein
MDSVSSAHLELVLISDSLRRLHSTRAKEVIDNVPLQRTVVSCSADNRQLAGSTTQICTYMSH